MGSIGITETYLRASSGVPAYGPKANIQRVAYSVRFVWEAGDIPTTFLFLQSLMTSATLKAGWEKIPVGLSDACTLEMEVMPFTIEDADIRDSFIERCIAGTMECELTISETTSSGTTSKTYDFRLQRSNTTDVTVVNMEAKSCILKLTFVEKWRSLLEELPPLYKRDVIGAPILAAAETTTTGLFNKRVLDFFPKTWNTTPTSNLIFGQTKVVATSYYSAPSSLGTTVKTIPLWSAVSEPLAWASVSLGSATAAFDDLISGVVDSDEGLDFPVLNTQPQDRGFVEGTGIHVILDDPLKRSPVTQWASEFKNGYEFTRAFFEAFDFTSVVIGNELTAIDSEASPLPTPIEFLADSLELGIGALTVGRASVSIRHQPASLNDPTEFIADNGTPSLAEEEFSVKMPFHDVITSGGIGGVHEVEASARFYAISDMNVFRLFGYTTGGYLSYFRPVQFRGQTVFNPIPTGTATLYLTQAISEANNNSLPNLLCQRIIQKYGVAHSLSSSVVGIHWSNYVGSVFECDFPTSLGAFRPTSNRMQIVSVEADLMTNTATVNFILYEV